MTVQAPLCAAVDVGSHSVKLMIARRDEHGGWHRVAERVLVSGLGRGDPLRDGLAPDACDRTLDALDAVAGLIRAHRVRDLVVVGTMVLRQASDAGAFIAAVDRRTGLPLQVISGEEEARLSFLGAVLGLGPAAVAEGVLTVDIGGASTEVAWGRSRRPDGLVSLRLGSLSLTREWDLARPVSAAVVAAVTAAVTAALTVVPPLPPPRHLLGIGATPASLAALRSGQPIADGQEAQGLTLSLTEIDALCERLRRLPVAGRSALPGLHPERGAVILAGAIITRTVAERWPDVPLTVSAADLRLGLLEDRFGATG